MATAEEYAKMSDAEKKKEDWMNSKWRPMMGWMYMLTCTMDFVIFPVLWSIVQVIAGGEVKSQWSPITLQGAGLFHMAMGAVLGLAAWGRTQEKMAGANNGGIATPGSLQASNPTALSVSAPKPIARPITSAPTVTADPVLDAPAKGPRIPKPFPHDEEPVL